MNTPEIELLPSDTPSTVAHSIGIMFQWRYEALGWSLTHSVNYLLEEADMAFGELVGSLPAPPSERRQTQLEWDREIFYLHYD